MRGSRFCPFCGDDGAVVAPDGSGSCRACGSGSPIWTSRVVTSATGLVATGCTATSPEGQLVSGVLVALVSEDGAEGAIMLELQDVDHIRKVLKQQLKLLETGDVQHLSHVRERAN